MSIKSLNPYLHFNGTAAKAIQLYEKALGAKTQSIRHYGDLPGNEQCAADKDRVMHAHLLLGEWVIMISDVPSNRPVPLEGNMQVMLEFDDEAELTQKFNALAEGGQVLMPVANTFWGAKFGMLTDAYGMSWMFSCSLAKSQS